jgi:hypothetical protein
MKKCRVWRNDSFNVPTQPPGEVGHLDAVKGFYVGFWLFHGLSGINPLMGAN